jgi:protocatechuate 3,4-dioxygenase beta subunit
MQGLAMSAVLLSWLFLLAAPAQQATTPNSPDLCTVQGVVVNANTGEPLRKANVIIWSDEGRHREMGSTTDAIMGRFELKGLYPGRYRLLVDRNGYVAEEYGHTPHRKVAAPGRWVSKEDNERGKAHGKHTFRGNPRGSAGLPCAY